MTKLPPWIIMGAGYIRKSREDLELEARGIDTLSIQRDLIVRDILPRFNIGYDIFEEVASGDSIRERPEFQKVLAGIEKGTYQAIICKDLSRLGRGSYGDQGVIFDLIVDKRIFIITSDSVLDPHNFNDKRMIRFSLFFNREEYEMTLWRLSTGKYDGAKKGNWTAGSVPFGMQYNNKTQKLEANPNQAEIVRIIFDMFAHDGLGYRAISSKLKKMGILSPKEKPVWQPMQIFRMLQNRAYHGDVVFKKTRRSKTNKNSIIKNPEEDWIITESAHDPIIDEETWQKAQDRLHETQSRPRVKLDFSACELAGIVTCHQCGKKMVRQYSVSDYKKKDGTISKYEREYLYCADCSISVKYRSVERQMLTMLAEKMELSEEKLQEEIQNNIQSLFKEDVIDVNGLLVGLETKRKSVEVRIKNAMDEMFNADSKIPRNLLEDQIVRYNEELKQIESQIEQTSSLNKEPIKPTVKIDVNAVRGTIKSVLDAYKRLQDKSRKNELLREVFDYVGLERTERSKSKKEESKFELYFRFRYGVLS